MSHSLWLCPVCKQSLLHLDNSLRCDNGHLFDIAKEGYINLLLSHQRNSNNPGDNREMVIGRREFLNQGHYQPLAEFISGLILQHTAKDSAIALLDIGCGEGFYTTFLANAIKENKIQWIGGIDISKEAIKQAAKRRHPEVDFAVASNINIPIADNALSMVTEIFAPDCPQEIARILKKDGLFIHVTPGEDHLFSLREMVYDTPQKHQLKPMTDPSFTLLEQHHLRFELNLGNSTDVGNLLRMTPYYWQLDESRQQQILSTEALSTEASFVITVYQNHQQTSPWAKREIQSDQSL